MAAGAVEGLGGAARAVERALPELTQVHRGRAAATAGEGLYQTIY